VIPGMMNGTKPVVPFSGTAVVLVPEEGRRREERLYKSTSTDQDGQFPIRGITPGDLHALCLGDSRTGRLHEP
jgi:hypothetical protein